MPDIILFCKGTIKNTNMQTVRKVFLFHHSFYHIFAVFVSFQSYADKPPTRAHEGMVVAPVAPEELRVVARRLRAKN
jgi:hypothetical protein